MDLGKIVERNYHDFNPMIIYLARAYLAQNHVSMVTIVVQLGGTATRRPLYCVDLKTGPVNLQTA